MPELTAERIKALVDELDNFRGIAQLLMASPREVPRLPGIDISSLSLPYSGAVGGDHIVYLDFNVRYDLDALIARASVSGRHDVARELGENRRRAGILLADVAGHRLTDAMVAAMLHQAFLLGASYELELSGQITTRLFQYLQTRFYESTNIQKLVAMIYGEITTAGRFRYLSAGHPPPLVFSREFGRLMPLDSSRTISQGLLGLFPAKGVASEGTIPVNEIQLLAGGDILLLATDGLTDHLEGRFVAEVLTPCLDRAKDLPAAGICQALREAVLAAGPPDDDVTVVVVKKL